MHVGQDGAGRPDVAGAGDRFVEREVARMRRVAQGVHDEDVRAAHVALALLRQRADVGGVGETADPEAEAVDVAVPLAVGHQLDRAALPLDREADAGLDAVVDRDRRVVRARRGAEAVAEGLVQARGGRRVRVGRDAPAAVQHEGAQVVDAVDVVGVRMGVDDAVGPIDLRVQHLLPEIRPGVDHDDGAVAVGADALHQQRRPAAAVLRVAGVAGAPVVTDPRHARRRPAAEQREPQPRSAHAASAAARGTLAKSLRKFAVVVAAIAAGVTPLTAASTSQVWAT